MSMSANQKLANLYAAFYIAVCLIVLTALGLLGWGAYALWAWFAS